MSNFSNSSLRIEKSQNKSGEIIGFAKIPILREEDYYVVKIGLDGDAPKEFIKAYFFLKKIVV